MVSVFLITDILRFIHRCTSFQAKHNLYKPSQALSSTSGAVSVRALFPSTCWICAGNHKQKRPHCSCLYSARRQSWQSINKTELFSCSWRDEGVEVMSSHIFSPSLWLLCPNDERHRLAFKGHMQTSVAAFPVFFCTKCPTWHRFSYGWLVILVSWLMRKLKMPWIRCKRTLKLLYDVTVQCS